MLVRIHSQQGVPMDATRRDVLAAAVTAAGATATHDLAHAEDHDHQDVPSDVALRVKSLESLLVEKKIVDRAALNSACQRRGGVAPAISASEGNYCQNSPAAELFSRQRRPSGPAHLTELAIGQRDELSLRTTIELSRQDLRE
jgi:hypothetical protein